MSFRDICGQESAISFLKGAMERGRVSHAYLFSGMSGVGKRTTAQVFAKALNCTGGGSDACGECLSCRKIDRQNHPDVVTLKPEGPLIKIQEIRDLQNQMRFKPLEGRKRVFILVDADRMNQPAANSLLKTLEEPSPANVLILTSSRPHQLPLTILSRCQQVRFSPLRTDQVASCLAARPDIGEASAAVLAASSGGSIGKALAMHQDSYLKVRDEIIGKISQCRLEDPLGTLVLVDLLGKERETVLEGLDVLKTWYRDILVYRETGEEERLIHRDRMEAVRTFARGVSRRAVLENIRAVNRAANAIERNANKQLTLETMLFKLAHPAAASGPERSGEGL